MKLLLALSATIVFACSAAPVEPTATAPPVTGVPDETLVHTALGAIRGAVRGEALAFTAVPYAEPPTGPRRFAPPQPLGPWEGELEATSTPPPCMQVDGASGAPVGAEDCLLLDVWRPRAAAAAPRPVLVFIHGGGNMTGSISDERAGARLYDGDALAVHADAVVVTLQYRLNVFGYYVRPELDAERPRGRAANHGLLDQLEALRFVKAHIPAFGGDPSRVLLFGESGGASDVCALLASPLAAGLFQRAVLQSGGCGGRGYDELRAFSESVEVASSCATASDVLGCMRSADAESLARAAARPTTTSGQIQVQVGPTIDGYLLEGSPLAVIARGAHNHMPIIVGSNTEETASAMFGIPRDLSARAYEAALDGAYGARAEAVRALYPVEDYPTPRDALVAVTTDAQFTCPTQLLAERSSAAQAEPVYRYVYGRALEPDPADLGAAHGIELFFAFRTLLRTNYLPLAADERLLDAMPGYWAALARDGSIGVPELPAWPRYALGADRWMGFGDGLGEGEGFRRERCAFWASRP